MMTGFSFELGKKSVVKFSVVTSRPGMCADGAVFGRPSELRSKACPKFGGWLTYSYYWNLNARIAAIRKDFGNIVIDCTFKTYITSTVLTEIPAIFQNLMEHLCMFNATTHVFGNARNRSFIDFYKPALS